MRLLRLTGDWKVCMHVKQFVALCCRWAVPGFSHRQKLWRQQTVLILSGSRNTVIHRFSSPWEAGAFIKNTTKMSFHCRSPIEMQQRSHLSSGMLRYGLLSHFRPACHGSAWHQRKKKADMTMSFKFNQLCNWIMIILKWYCQVQPDDSAALLSALRSSFWFSELLEFVCCDLTEGLSAAHVWTVWIVFSLFSVPRPLTSAAPVEKQWGLAGWDFGLTVSVDLCPELVGPCLQLFGKFSMLNLQLILLSPQNTPTYLSRSWGRVGRVDRPVTVKDCGVFTGETSGTKHWRRSWIMRCMQVDQSQSDVFRCSFLAFFIANSLTLVLCVQALTVLPFSCLLPPFLIPLWVCSMSIM